MSKDPLEQCYSCNLHSRLEVDEVEAFDTEHRKHITKIVDYCDNILGECDPTICEYRFVQTQAYQLQSIKQLIARHISNNSKDPVFGDAQNLNLNTAIKFIDEILEAQ